MKDTIDIPAGPQQADLVYKVIGDRKILLTYLPPVKKCFEKAPLYLIIPGGGWHMEKREDMIAFSQVSVDILREKGFAVASIDYRVTTEPNIVMRDIVNDCFDALRYLVHFADTLEFDPHRIAISGHSAGAHLALMLGYCKQELFRQEAVFEDPYTVKVLAPLSPPTILYTEGVPGTSGLYNLWKAFIGVDTLEERKAMSPYDQVSADCPPTLLCAGTSDHLVYSTSSELLYDRLQENHVPCKLVLSICAGHSFEPMHPGIPASIPSDEMQKTVVEYILQHI